VRDEVPFEDSQGSSGWGRGGCEGEVPLDDSQGSSCWGRVGSGS
jgi:hypothetical protein